MKTTFAAIAILLSSVAASAQCNGNHTTVSDELHTSGATLVGTVLGAEAVPDSSFHLDGVNYDVQIDRMLHGRKIGSETVTVFSENIQERFPMQVGRQYLLFVHLDYDRYEVNSCGNSGLLEASDIANVQQLKQYAKR